MSNHLAIAAVTATLKQMIADALRVDGANVTVGRPPADDSGKVGANLYLYRVAPNAALRNDHLATRRADGTEVQRPKIAYDLYYLITFYGKEDQLEPELLMGSCVTALHARPILEPAKIRWTIDKSEDRDYLAGADLDLQPELVKLTPITMTLEELSKLWTVFFQMTHRLSIAYQASAVVLEADLPEHRPLPVGQVEPK